MLLSGTDIFLPPSQQIQPGYFTDTFLPAFFFVKIFISCMYKILYKNLQIKFISICAEKGTKNDA